MKSTGIAGTGDESIPLLGGGVRIYVDESGTHGSSPWLVIGILFVPDHGMFHSELCGTKESQEYS